MFYSKKEIQKLIDNLDIVQVIGEYVNLKKAGSDYKGLSPFKEEKTPSFTVSPVKNIFKDFSTQIGGNVISFYMTLDLFKRWRNCHKSIIFHLEKIGDMRQLIGKLRRKRL